MNFGIEMIRSTQALYGTLDLTLESWTTKLKVVTQIPIHSEAENTNVSSYQDTAKLYNIKVPIHLQLKRI